MLQGSNILDGIWTRHSCLSRQDRVTLKLMIKEDHLLACHHENAQDPNINNEISRLHWQYPREDSGKRVNDLDRLDNYCCTQQLLSTHPRGYPTIHLSKSSK